MAVLTTVSTEYKILSVCFIFLTVVDVYTALCESNGEFKGNYNRHINNSMILTAIDLY